MVKELLSQLELGNDMTKFIIILSLFVVVATVLVAILFRDFGWVKYILGIIILIVGVFKFLAIANNLVAEENLGNLMTIMLLGIIGVVSLCTSGIFSIIVPKRRKRRKRRVIKENTTS
ncbi:MAG: hypothetical protein GX219_08170 [Tissierellia bacterium]|nr:hypothetical protein [Tissierellia bacterium]